MGHSQVITENKKYVLVIHGGAGTIEKKNMTPEQESAYLKTLDSALIAGNTILKNGGTSVDAVQAAVMVMEDSPLFNAGRGAVFNSEGKNEMDAAIMSGNGKAGAVACVSGIKNPILAARTVMDSSAHVLLSGEGAELFAKSKGLEFRDSAYFATEFRWKQLQKAKLEDKIELDHQSQPDSSGLSGFPDFKYGTVGAVALDQYGNLAAATSTGGLTNKKYGRIGDSPLIGCGTWASNETCAVSCTGNGEYFIRSVAAHEVSSRFKYKGGLLKTAVCETLEDVIKPAGGKGGIIAISNTGEVVMHFTTKGMYRGVINQDGIPASFIYP